MYGLLLLVSEPVERLRWVVWQIINVNSYGLVRTPFFGTFAP